MVFSSHIFLFYFLPLALLLYYAAPRTLRHLMLTLVSYVFYGWWNPWFTILMLVSTQIDYYCGKMICADGATPRRRKTGMILSVVSNLSLLAFFKYTTFLAGNASALAQPDELNIPGTVCIREQAATEEVLAAEILKLLQDDERRNAIANSARRRGRPHAAREIASEILQIANG